MSQERADKRRERGQRLSWFMRRREECYDGPIWVPPGRPRNWFVYVVAFVVRPVLKLLFRYKVEGRENIPAAGDPPVVFACNHVSFADPAIMWCVLWSYCRGSRFLARSSLFRPVVGGMFCRCGAIPVDPDAADTTAVKRAAKCLKRGEHMLVFPEGTRMNRPDKVYRAHAGVVLIARMGKAKIVPIGISGTEKIMPYGKPRFLRFPRVKVRFGEPIDPRDAKYDEIPKKGRSTAIANEVMDSCFALRDAAAES